MGITMWTNSVAIETLITAGLNDKANMESAEVLNVKEFAAKGTTNFFIDKAASSGTLRV